MRSPRPPVIGPASGKASPAGWRVRVGRLGVRYVAMIVAITLVSGVILGTSVALISLRNAAEEHQRSLEYAGTVVAASLLPVVADLDPQRIEAQMDGVLATSTRHEIECIRITDPTGVVIAETSHAGACGAVGPPEALTDIFTQPQVVEVPIEVEGLHVADVSIQFRPVGLEGVLVEPLTTTFIVLGAAMVLSALWGGWMVLRLVVEPIGELRDAASLIAGGARSVELESGRGDEIGELARALNHMTQQLAEQEAELMGSYQSLETAFHDKAELARRLERTMSMKSEFVAVASHEIRSPLAVIRLYAEMLEDNEFGELDPQLTDAIEAIVDAVGRLSTIVGSLLDVALLERGLMPIEVSEVDVGGIVEQAVADANVVARRHGVSVVQVGETPEAVMDGDPVRLRQVIDNLVSNAIKYSGGADKVTVSLRVEGDWAVIDVADRGVGVDQADADVLFELFGRVDAADNATVPGLGLGLPIAGRIVKAHGGTVTFRPNPAGSGTVFTVRLPLGAAPVGREGAISVV